MEAILTNVTSFVTSVTGWVSSVATTVTSSPVLFIFVAGIPLAGAGIGLMNRIIRG